MVNTMRIPHSKYVGEKKRCVFLGCEISLTQTSIFSRVVWLTWMAVLQTLLSTSTSDTIRLFYDLVFRRLRKHWGATWGCTCKAFETRLFARFACHPFSSVSCVWYYLHPLSFLPVCVCCAWKWLGSIVVSFGTAGAALLTSHGPGPVLCRPNIAQLPPLHAHHGLRSLRS